MCVQSVVIFWWITSSLRSSAFFLFLFHAVLSSPERAVLDFLLRAYPLSVLTVFVHLLLLLLSVYSRHSCVCVCVCMCVCVCACVCVCVCVLVSSGCLSGSLSPCLCVCVCMSVHLAICPSTCLSAMKYLIALCLSVFLSVSVSVCLSLSRVFLLCSRLSFSSLWRKAIFFFSPFSCVRASPSYFLLFFVFDLLRCFVCVFS
jgi:hypothetical protein